MGSEPCQWPQRASMLVPEVVWMVVRVLVLVAKLRPELAQSRLYFGHCFCFEMVRKNLMGVFMHQNQSKK